VLGGAGFRSGGDGTNGHGYDPGTSAFTSGVATPASGTGIKLNLSR